MLLLGIDSRDVPTTGMAIGKARNVGSEGTVGKSGITGGGLGGMAKATSRGARPTLRGRDLLHSEKMRRDKTVPGDVR